MKLARILIPLALLFPVVAAAASPSLVDIDVSSGVIAGWVGKTLGIARGALPLMFVVALLFEAAQPPSAPKDFGGVIWRLLIVMALLAGYTQIFSTVMAMTSGIAAQIAPTEIWSRLSDATVKFLEAKRQFQMRELVGGAKAGSVGDTALGYVGLNLDTLGGSMLDTLVTMIVLTGQAMFRVLGTFGNVLAGLLFVLGPLSIVLSVPRGSDTGMRWFRVFASVLSWPIISALIVGLVVEFGLKTLTPTSSYEAAFNSLVLSGILCVCAFAVPTVASALMGSGLGALGTGFASMQSWMAGTVGRAATGAAALAGVAGFAGNAGAGGGGGSSGRLASAGQGDAGRHNAATRRGASFNGNPPLGGGEGRSGSGGSAGRPASAGGVSPEVAAELHGNVAGDSPVAPQGVPISPGPAGLDHPMRVAGDETVIAPHPSGEEGPTVRIFVNRPSPAPVARGINAAAPVGRPNPPRLGPPTAGVVNDHPPKRDAAPALKGRVERGGALAAQPPPRPPPFPGDSQNLPTRKIPVRLEKNGGEL